ncbi:hypothetical protein JRO89_XS13G0068400 [Xanthoceras sorbifolium]|uniref:Leucine-rich repeat-containing N-terminal plant-type domain-containing protein n=1 Tax=Xanthoceras sorbifolium TaxID=99658 RepID=A0ABQ8H706_9ROSI|nr:hypothetical protein JRO89_XS13G0068400 [Xanthoceras sorbifolium]
MSGRSLQLAFLFILLSLTTKSAFVISSEVGDAHIKCIERERHALLMIKQSLIDEYGHLSSWGNEENKKDFCKWRGVGCSNQTGRVAKLNLQVTSFFDIPVMSLKGNISSFLIELKHLNYLDMSFNDFGGQQIPEFIGSLNKLRLLGLSAANFSGRVPYQLGNLSRLQSLDLSNNFGMYAEKLEWLSHLSNLRHLHIDNVQLTKAVDWLQVVSELPYLNELQSRCLVTLDLSNNKIQGPIPDYALWNMSSLLYLDLTENGITGIPRSFGNLCRLKTLTLERNNLTGELPELFLNLSAGCTKSTLQVLTLNNNMLSGSLPDFTLFSSLRELYLYENRLNGSFPNSFAQFSGITILDLSSNQLVGSLPDYFSVLTSMAALDVSRNRLNGTLPETYMGNPELCGDPLPNKCRDNEPPQPPAATLHENEDGFETRGFYVSMILGFITGFWGVCAEAKQPTGHMHVSVCYLDFTSPL